jgi:hypothetical protein
MVELSEYLPELDPPDLLEKLRAWSKGGDGGHCFIMEQAADEIERLRTLCAQYSRGLHREQRQ